MKKKELLSSVENLADIITVLSRKQDRKIEELLERIEYLEDKVLELQATDTQIYQRIETICQIIALSDLYPLTRTNRGTTK